MVLIKPPSDDDDDGDDDDDDDDGDDNDSDAKSSEYALLVDSMALSCMGYVCLCRSIHQY
jgi:hypothetical protein